MDVAANNTSVSPDQTDLPVNIVKGTHDELIAFLVLNVWTSHFGLPLLLLIIYWKKIQRHPTFISLLVAFIVVGLSSSLLLYAGKIEGPEPSKLLCLTQASLLYGITPLTSSAALVLVIQMWFVIRASYQGQEYLDRDHILRSWAMLVFPWFTFVVTVLTTAIVGSQNPDRISRSRRFFYCSVENLPLTNTITTVAAFFLFATFVYEVWTMAFLYKRWVAIRRQGSKLRWNMELSLPLRILAFGIFVIIALSLSLLSVNSPETPIPDLVIASASTVVFFIFGTQVDILRALCFWRKTPPPVPSKARRLSIDSTTKPATKPDSDFDSLRKWSLPHGVNQTQATVVRIDLTKEV
ncbi:hypothetical protein AX16_000160 [Volvariella volvacea WC 439]|nr:hypothetical protein AX16_000160 [Volvariella volvacea WC 439]